MIKMGWVGSPALFGVEPWDCSLRRPWERARDARQKILSWSVADCEYWGRYLGVSGRDVVEACERVGDDAEAVLRDVRQRARLH